MAIAGDAGDLPRVVCLSPDVEEFEGAAVVLAVDGVAKGVLSGLDRAEAGDWVGRFRWTVGAATPRGL